MIFKVNSWKPINVMQITCVIALTFLLSHSALANDLPTRIMSMGQTQATITYEGSLIYTRSSEMASYKIYHTNIDNKEYLRMRRLENGQSDIVQKGNTFFCIHKKNKATSVAEFSNARPQSFSLNSDLIARGIRFYDIEQENSGIVAGRKCDWVSLTPINKDRLTHKFCVDAEHNFALSSEMYSSNRQLLEKMSFVDIKFTQSIDSSIFEMQAGADEELIRKNITSKDSSKPIPITLSWLPAGFEHIASKERKHPTGRMIDTYLYSDGFSSFTVFVEKPHAVQRAFGKPFDKMKIKRMGSSTMVSRPLASYKVSVVGELPTEILKKIITKAAQ